MPKFLNLVSQSGKQEFVDIKDFNKNPNAYGKYKIRMVDDSSGKNYDIPATMFGQAQQDGLRPWNMEKTATAKPQPTTSQPSSRNVAPTPSMPPTTSSTQIPSDWGYTEMVNPKGVQSFGAPPVMSMAEQKAKNQIQAAMDVLTGRKTDGTNAERDNYQRAAQRRTTSAQRQMQDQIDYAAATGQPLVDDFNVKNQREVDIFTPTGKEGKGFSMLNFGVAPTVARDKNGLPILNEQGMPVKGMVNDEVRASYQRQTEADARQRELGLHEKTTDEKLADLYKQRDELLKRIKKPDPANMNKMQFGMFGGEDMNTQLTLIEIDKQIKSLEAVRDKDDLALGGVFRGLKNTALNLRNWDFGLSELALMGKMEEIKNKIDKGKYLTADEQEFARSKIGADAAAALEDEQMGDIYRYTKIGGESLPYMADFILTGGYAGLSKWGARQGLNAAAKLFTSKVGRGIAQMGGRNIAAATLKNTGVLIGDLAGAYAMATTIQAGKTTADILKRHQGDLYIDENGDFKFEGGQSMLSAAARGVNAAMIENATEKFGEHLPGINVSKIFAKAGLGNASRFLNNMTSKEWYRTVSKISNRAGVQGYPSEIIEEYINIPLNATIVGDNSMSDLLDPQTHGDILGGMALSIGMLGAVGLGGHLVNKSTRRLAYNRYNNSLNKADAAAAQSFGDNWQGDLKDAIDNTTNDDMGAMIGFIKSHPNMTEQQRTDALTYIDRLIKVRGFNLGMNAQMKDNTTPPQPHRSVVVNVNVQSGVEPFAVISYDENGNLIERKKFMDEEKAQLYKEKLDIQRTDNDAKNVYSSIFIKDTDGSLRQQMDDMLSNIGYSLDGIKSILNKNPLKRTDEEQNAVDQMVQFASQLVYPSNEVHEEKDAQDGADIAEGTEIGDQQAIDTINQREANAISAWNEIDDPDLKNFVTTLTEGGSTPNEIVEWLRYYDYSEDVIAAFCELCNAKAEKEGYLNRTGQKIEEQVAQQVKQNTFAGTFNGEGTPIILQVQDENGTPLYVVGGNISADEQGVLSSDGLVVLRDGQGNFIQRPNMQGLTLAGTYSVEDYSNSLLAQTQEAVTAQIQSTESQEQQTEEQQTEEQKPETQQPQEQKPTIPVDKDGKKLYTQAPVEDTIADITSELGGDMDSVQSVVITSAENANARLKAAQEKKKKGIKGKDPQEMIANANKLNQEISDAQAEADYWSNALNQIAPQQQAAEEPVSQEQPIEEKPTEEQPTEEQPQSIDETTVPVEQRAAEMYGKLEDEEVRENLDTKISELNKQLSRLPKKPKMVADENAYLQEKEKLNAQRQELQKKLDYWTAVKDYIQKQTKTTPEDIKAAQDELSGTNARLDFAKQTEQGATTPIEIAGEFVKNAKIVPSDFYAETGMQAADARKQFPGMLSNNGVTIASLAEQLVQHDNDNYGGRFFKGDDMEARNAIIQALTGAESRKALGRDMTAEEQEYARVREQQREDFHQENYGMSYSDYLAFEEQQMPNIWSLISNFAPEQYDQMVAEYYESLPEDYFTQQNQNNNGTEQQNPTVAGSNEILPQPQVDNKEGDTGSQDPAAAEGNGGKGDNQDDEVSGDTLNDGSYQLSDELDENGRQFVLNSKGGLEFGYISDETGLKPAPILLSEGIITNRQTGDGYGLVHIEFRHGDQIRNAGYKSVLDFIEEVGNNYEVIREGKDRLGNQTYLLQLTDKHNNTLIVELSGDGSYWNINTAGIFKRNYARNNKEVYNRHTTTKQSAETAEASQGAEQSDTQTPSSMNAPTPSGDKDTTKSPNSQENQQKTDENGDNLTLPTITEQDIDADEVADENAKELAKDFLRGENTGTIAELFYREIVGRIMDKEGSEKQGEKSWEKMTDDEKIKTDWDRYLNESILDKVNKLISKSTHDVKIDKFNGEDEPTTLIIDGKPSKVYIHASRFDDTNKARYDIIEIENYEKDGVKKMKIADKLLDEFNATVSLENQGTSTMDSEEKWCASFNNLDAAIAFEKWMEQKKGEKKEDKKKDIIKAAQDSGKLIIGGIPESKPKTQAPKTDTPKQEKKSDTKQAFDEFKDVMKKFRNAGRADANVSLIGLNARQIEMLADVFRATAKLGYAMVKDGATVFNDWLEKMRAMVSDTIKANSQWNDQDITDLLTETWNNKYLVDGVRKPLSEWAAEEAVNAEQEQEKKDEEEKEEQPATVPDNSVVGQSQFPYTKEELEAMTKEQMISAMWQKVFPVVCEKYKVPSDTMDENAYWFAPKMTKGYPKDSLVAACMKYMEHLNDEVAQASEKQMNYIMSLAAEDERRLFRDITLTKTAASRVINLLKQEENMINGISGSADEFNEIANELEKIARLNGADLSQKDQKKAEKQFVNNTIDALQNALKTGEKPFKSITDIRKAAREAGMEIEDGKDDIKLQELVEDALVKVARDIMTEARIPGQRDIHKFRKETFEKIKLLYNLQPTISMRSSNRVALQQYSTPLPMAFCADMFANGRIMRMFYSAFEPTAGNGMLVFGIPSHRVHVNEIDENRLENLRGQGFKQVTSQDATQPFTDEQYHDAIITNPPFGEAAAKDYDGYQISGLAPQIALNALSKMRDFGRAVIIIGGEQKFASNGVVQNDKPFLAYLYNHYNVKGVIDMDGSLYAKQGTTYPTRMILIDGRRTEEERAKSNVYPPVQKNWIPKADSFDKLYDTVNELLNSKQKTNGTEIVRSEEQPLQSDRSISETGDGDTGTDSRKPVPNVATGEGGLRPNRGTGKGSKRGSTSGISQRSLFDGSGDLSDGVQTGDGRTTGGSNGSQGEGVDNREFVVDTVPGVSGPAARGVGLNQKQEKRKLESEKLSYRPHNTAFSLESVAPAAMVEAMDKTLKRIEDEYGNIDEFVTNELGYDSVDAMHKALAAEQVDSVAMAIYNMKKGEALVIGDQTGVGKGRQMAALIRWAVKQGKKPVFMTQKSNLFNDIYRDLKDIGSENLKPFIFNNDKDAKISEITEDENGNEKEKLIYRSATESDITKALQDGKIPDDCDFVLCTYSQVSTGDSISREYEDSLNSQETDGDNKKRSRSRRKPKPGAKPRKDTKATLLRKLAKDNYLMLDESHTAAGESNQGYYMQTLVRDSKAVTFASATYAKRPDTMPLYAMRTSMSKANIGMRELIDAIQKGGVTLQEIMSRALTDSGQMVRRERDMTGVVTDWTTIDDPETVKKAKENYDRTIQAFNAIIDFQNTYLEAYLENQRESLAVVAGNAGYVRGTEKMGVNNTPFANKTYNYTKQLMLALKVDAIVDEVERQIKEGKKPVIALDNTMGSMLTDLAVGEELEDSTFAASLLRGLDSVMQYTQKDGMGGSYKIKIHPNELGAEGEAAYYQLVSFIKESTKDVFISPLDEIIGKLREKGYKVGELTGRDKVVVEEDGKYYVAKKGKTSKQLLQSRFNNNKLDVLILNKTGSTGISLHASKTFADQRQRVMILAQPLPDINDYMQMIGRIDRTGQVQRGYYINLGLPVPAEQRFLMMLSTKLKSLNANTTTSQDSKDNNVEAPDMLNKYGSQVIVEYFKDHPDVYNKLGTDPLNVANEEGGLSEYKTKPDDTDARKLTGHVALLPTDEQQAFYDDVVERYNTLIKYLDDTGTNDLKITSLPLNAKTLAKAVSSKGTDPEGNNPFAKNAYCEMVEMDVLRKPMKADEVRKAIESVAKGKDPKQAVEDIKSQYESEYQERIDKQKRKYDSDIERNKETLAKFEEKINSNEKMSEEDKKKAVEDKRLTLQQETDRKNEQATKALNFDHERMMKNLDRYTVGESYLMPDNPDVMTFELVSPAIFLGYKAKDNGITPSSTIAVFATLDGRRRVEIKLSEQNKLNNISEVTSQNYDAAQEVTLDNWDNNAPNQTRKTGYIMTGNILQAIKDTQDENGAFPGQLVSYTDSEGNIHDGILMPDKWQPSMMINAGKPISEMMDTILNGNSVISINGEVEINVERSRAMGNAYILRVPKSKKTGQKYWENKELSQAIDGREYYQSAGKFQAYIPNGKLKDVLAALDKMGVKVSSDIASDLYTEAINKGNYDPRKNSFGTKYSELDETKFRLREEPAPKKTGIGYKVFVLKNGKLYPPMVANPNGADTPVGVWLDADAAPVSGTSKTGRPQVKAGGKGTQGGSGQLAYRPGWHLGTIPYALQFNRKNPETGERELFPNNFVWAEVEYANDVDYQEEANKEGINESGKYQHSLAGLKKLPKNGSYMYRTNPDPRTDPWIITGAMKVNKILTPSEVDNLVREAGREPQPRQEGAVTDEQINNLNKELEKQLNPRGRKGNGSAKPSDKLQSKMREKAESLAKSLNVQVEITTSDKLSGTEATAKGFYTPRTGKVVIVLDNNSSILDIEQTIAHEVIGHKGLRGLLGRANYYKLLNTIYDNLSEEDKKAIDEAARQNGWQLYTAIDEYLADQAEKMAWDARSASLWQNIVHYLTEALRNLGFIFKPNYKDARYWLWLSKNNLKRSDVMSNIRRNALLAKLDKLSRPEPTVKKDDVLSEPQYLHRDGNYVDSAAYDAIEENLRKKAFYWKEAFIDYMQAYQVFQEEMEKGLKNGLMDNQNALLGENALTSAIEQQQSDFLRIQLRPLQDLIKSLQDEFGSGREGIRNIENYLMMKHGLERNRVLFMRDWYKKESERKIKSSGELSPEAEYIYERMEQAIWQDFDDGNIDEKERDKQLLIALNDAHQQYLSNVMSEFNRIKNDELEYYDYEVKSLAESYQAIDDFINQHTTFDPNKHDMSGLTALNEYFSGNKYEDDKIIAEVESLDRKIGFDTAQELMDAVQNVSQFALDQDYKNGLVTKESYNRAKNMFRYYVPLRGFDDTTMEDVYGYMTYSKGTGSKSLVHANGRFSKAGSPLATASNMALNAIARGLRNQNKQRAYRLVNTWLKDNPEAKAPAIVADLWVGLDNNGNDIVHTPNITDDMSAEEIQDEIDRFNEEMKFLESLGKASKVKSEASFRHRFSSDNHKYEHIVPLMINGKAKMIVFNGNPRPAQALRGDLQPTVNKDSVIERIFGEIRRIMAGAFTSYNPSFMATNLLRDTGFANNNIAIKEGLEYYAKFTNNQRKLLTKNIGMYARLKWDYDKGIAPRNEMEQYFHEFMRNGGKTGFVNQTDIERLQKKLWNYNKQLSIHGKILKIINSLPEGIKAVNERIENINRFAAYMTSRQMGRSVMRSVYDAKEVSVNFNRKGAGGNTAKATNATKGMKLAAGLASIARTFYLFFNAGMQSLNLLSKNFKGNTYKTAAYAVGIPLLLGGAIIPLFNQILAECFGDGDDDPYANLPEWTRRNNFCFYLSHGTWLKIPLPIELRAFYGLGDIAAGYLINNNLKSEKNVALDMGAQLTQILPVDFLGEGGSIGAALTPDVIKPIEQIKANTDWTGKPIYKESQWNQYEPEYTKAFKGEFEPFVNLSKWINEVSGGSDHVKGSLDSPWNNPAIWHAVIQGYGGGAIMDLVRVGNIANKVYNGEIKKLSAQSLPVIKAVLETPTEKTQFYRMLNKFYNYREEANEFEHNLNEWRKSDAPLEHSKFIYHVNPDKPSAEFRRLKIIKEYEGLEKKINNILKNPKLSETEKESWEAQKTKAKVDAVKKLDQIE